MHDYHDNRLQIVLSYRYMHEVLTSDQGHITQHTKHLVGTLDKLLIMYDFVYLHVHAMVITNRCFVYPLDHVIENVAERQCDRWPGYTMVSPLQVMV